MVAHAQPLHHQCQNMAETEKENVPPVSPGRFRQSTEEDKQRLLDSRTPRNTTTATTFWVRVFKDYIASSPKKGLDLKTCSPTEIALLLESFYIDVRKKDQTAYKRNSYLAARSAIHRHLLSLRSDVDLFNSSLFRKSNHVLDGVLKTKKKNGEEPAVQRKEAISDND